MTLYLLYTRVLLLFKEIDNCVCQNFNIIFSDAIQKEGSNCTKYKWGCTVYIFCLHLHAFILGLILQIQVKFICQTHPVKNWTFVLLSRYIYNSKMFMLTVYIVICKNKQLKIFELLFVKLTFAICWGLLKQKL